MPGGPRLSMDGIEKSFPGVRALREVSLSVPAGEVHAILGENGAGKSTLCNVLSGAFSRYDGQIFVDGERADIHSPKDAQELGIAMIHQELNLVPDMSIADNIFLGREPRTRLGTIDHTRMRARTRELLTELGLTLEPRRLIRNCRIAEQQLIEVAKTLVSSVRILVMDEPTSALADAEVNRLFGVIRSLTARGVAVLYISHRLEELAEIADRVTVLRDGANVGTLTMAEATRAELIRLMVGRAVGELFPRKSTASTATDLASVPSSGPGASQPSSAPSARDAPERDGPERDGPERGAPQPRGQTGLRVEGLTLEADPASGRAALHGVDLTASPGEIVGLAGLMGAGRTEVLAAIYGAYGEHVVRGRFRIDGAPYRPHSPATAIERGIAFIAEDRKAQSLILSQHVRFNASLAALRSLRRWFTVDRAKERQVVAQQVESLRIKTTSLTAMVANLSGGNQQKVVLAKCLLTNPAVLLMDEPTRGIDVGAKAEIYALMSDLAEQGAAIVMVSSELPELLAMCDRIVVLCEGRATAELPASEATQERILEAATDRQSVVMANGPSSATTRGTVREHGEAP